MSGEVKSVKELDFIPPESIHPSPADWRDQFIYFLMVDRFDNNQDNIPAYDPAATPQNRRAESGRNFQGGNLKGVMRRLDYIKNLGCTAIWLSPIFKNRREDDFTYHGYGIQDFLEVDPRFGTFADLRNLVRKAHRKGMYVILDIIINHTGDNWSYPEGVDALYRTEPYPFGKWREADPAPGFQMDDAVWPEELQAPHCYKRRGRIRDFASASHDEAVNGDFCDLKELDIKNNTVLDTIIKAYKYWIGAADIDGFRVDTVKHMESSETAIFCNAVREYARRIGKTNFFIYGEVVGDDAVLQKYIGRNSRIDGTDERFPSLDACLDFPLYFILEEVIKGFQYFADLYNRYERFKTFYADHGASGQYFVTFVDNHDQMSRPHRRFMHNNPNTRQAVLAISYLLMSQGVPCIYYGTEQGFDGGGDNDRYVRECMFGGEWGAFETTGVHFFNSNHEIYRGIVWIAKVRAEHAALRYGRQYFREISADGISFGFPIKGNCTLAFSRILDTDEILVALNLDASPRNDCITVDSNLTPPGSEMTDLLNGGAPIAVRQAGGRAYVRVPLDGHGAAILMRKPA
ncbi:MAG: alpha-amylase [candidate division Zixibacteria bacterium HGW-Zixibacteria-1]|nr:MAG: alpha-amylase [candidate division Zixibacteria bacterium HGW-Zixibacteria-1]